MIGFPDGGRAPYRLELDERGRPRLRGRDCQYDLATMVQAGWRIVDADEDDRPILVAFGLAIEEGAS